VRRLFPVIVVALAGLVLVGLALAAVNRNYSVHATAALEVPANDSKAQGQAIFHVAKDGESIAYKLIVANIENVTMAHIHVGPPGVNGPVVVWLYPESPPAQLIPGRFQGVLAEGTITADDLVGQLAGAPLSDLIELLNTSGAYVNIHTSQYPGGEIRGNF
jgi:hypothetical protein